MRVLTAINIGYPPVGGAQITHRTYLQQLSTKFGYEGIYLDRSLTPQRLNCGSIRCDYFRDLVELRQKIEAARPEVIIAAFTLIQDGVKIGRQLGVPVIGWLNSYEYCPPTESEIEAWHLTHTHRYPSATIRNFALNEADQVVVNSHYLQDRLAAHTNVLAQVIYPPFQSSAWQMSRETEKKYITGICGYPHKGAGIFIELAKRFPNEAFLLVGAVQADLYPTFEALPNVTLLPFSPPKAFLAQAKLMLVPSQWPEPFGRVAIEAMGNGIPTLVSHNAGLAEIVGDAPHGVDPYHSIDAWTQKLTTLLASPQATRQNATEGRKLAEPYVSDMAVTQLEQLLQRLTKRRVAVSKKSTSKQVIALMGDASSATAFAMINNRVLQGLSHSNLYQLHHINQIDDFVPAPIDIIIHHNYTQDFGTMTLPNEGRFVAIRTWDFGRFPPKWVERINQECDQLWVYSRWIKKQAIWSGVPASKIKVISQGIDSQILTPSGPQFFLPTSKRFKFLFVGSAILRKGIDVLLKAYQQAFTAADDVCLVIKDNPKDTFYEGERWQAEIDELKNKATAPEILYLNQFVSKADMAALYRSCDMGVFPYRAEGFAMPILEAMACGTPAIAPRFGACLDFCSARTSFLVPVKRINLPVFDDFAFNTLGFRETVEEVDFCEVPVATLAETMQQIYQMSQQQAGQKVLAERAAYGVTVAHQRFTWQHTLQHVERALAQVSRIKTPVRMRTQRAKNKHQQRIFQAARELYLGLPGAANLPVRDP